MVAICSEWKYSFQQSCLWICAEKYLEEKMRNEDGRTSYRKSYSDHGGQPQYGRHGSRRPHNYDTAWDDDYSIGHPVRHHSKKKWKSHSYNYHDHHDDHLFNDEFYADDRMKQQQRRKPRNVDSANFDLWKITGRKRWWIGLVRG